MQCPAGKPDPDIHVDGTLTCTTHLSIVAHPFVEVIFADGCGLFQDNLPWQKAKMVRQVFDNNKIEVLTC